MGGLYSEGAVNSGRPLSASRDAVNVLVLHAVAPCLWRTHLSFILNHPAGHARFFGRCLDLFHGSTAAGAVGHHQVSLFIAGLLKQP